LYVLGVSAFYHDSAACLLKDGKVVAAAQEERFSRVKHDMRFPHLSIKYCLDHENITAEDISYVSFYEKTSKKFDRLFKTYLMFAPSGFESFVKSVPLWVKEKLWINKEVKHNLGFRGSLINPEHHESHAASAFFPSPFNSAAILTMDGVGEWATSSFGVGVGNSINLKSEMRFPHSIGLLYSAFTYYTGFRVNSGEYKLMGLAPYGEPKYVNIICDNLIDIKKDGSFRLDMSYFNYCTGLTMTNEKFALLFGRGPRKPETEITQLDMDLARSIQYVTEEIVLKIAKHVHSVTNENNLCLAGGVALNCVSNGRLYREGPFDRIWVQPAAGDAGGALGAALYVWHQVLNKERSVVDGVDHQIGSYLGPSYSDAKIKQFMMSRNISFESFSDSNEKTDRVAALLSEGNVLGWFNGRMEFGPRALGARSILGDPRSPSMQSLMNLKIKYRESFRPFAPAVIADRLDDWFEMGGVEDRGSFSSPYMLMVGHVKKNHLRKVKKDRETRGFDRLREIESDLPAVTHVDDSARLQTVHRDTNPEFYMLLEQFEKKTGCPVLINTSFNVRGEPIVESPEDAYRCFMRTEMDCLVLGGFLLLKDQQPEFVDSKSWQNEFVLD